ncbi:uncharacterized protein LOC116195928 isoform X1 [Punica granatum]|uniref:Uncharacterized protein LOC116195928 isoform X1 n=1 Tax=Punica granatum TaxID=22663 RepID=A0A6P8CL39_PUNGR|nr:uncharacterized protein LOC116195928 isoform X1 [Punica granatum]
MGTRFEYAINLLASSPISSSSSSKTNTTSFRIVNDTEKLRSSNLRAERRTEKRGLCGFWEQEREDGMMDRNEEIRNIEYIKKTMQMQEDVFKQQVRELHRLYNVQKMLMDEVKKQFEQSRIWAPLPTTTSSVTNMNSISWPNQAFPSPRNDPPSPRNFDLGGPIKGDISTDTSRGTNNEVGCSMEEHEVELTLSLGGKTSKRKPKAEAEKKFVPLLSIESDRGGPAPDNSGSTETSDRERKRPQWLFQV